MVYINERRHSLNRFVVFTKPKVELIFKIVYLREIIKRVLLLSAKIVNILNNGMSHYATVPSNETA